MNSESWRRSYLLSGVQAEAESLNIVLCGEEISYKLELCDSLVSGVEYIRSLRHGKLARQCVIQVVLFCFAI